MSSEFNFMHCDAFVKKSITVNVDGYFHKVQLVVR